MRCANTKQQTFKEPQTNILVTEETQKITTINHLINPYKSSTSTVPVMEHFYTLQGEGAFMGKAAYFIRLGGCDVGCVWCDVKDSWNAGKHPQWAVEDIVQTILKNIPKPQLTKSDSLHIGDGSIVVITGGEPLMHDLTELTAQLKAAGLRTHIETSGSSPLSGTLDWITLSPKKFKSPLPDVLPQAHELKVVVFNKSDFAWAEQWAAQVSADCRLYLQAEWSKRAQITPLIIDYIKAHPQWQLSLQAHKYIDVP